MLNKTQKYPDKHPFPAFSNCDNCFIPIAGTKSLSLWTVYKYPECHANRIIE